MIDFTDRPLTLEEQKEFLDTHMAPADRLTYLMQSKVVRMVLDNVYTPKDLDSAYQNLRKRVRDLESQHISDITTIIEQRRQIEMLAWRDEP